MVELNANGSRLYPAMLVMFEEMCAAAGPPENPDTPLPIGEFTGEFVLGGQKLHTTEQCPRTEIWKVDPQGRPIGRIYNLMDPKEDERYA